MVEFLKSYAALIATVALIQPWLWAAYRRWFRKGQVQFYETGKIELGYSAAGPTVGLWGTLRGRLEDVFIRKIDLKIVRHSDSATHIFGWAAFRGDSLSGQPTVPHSFNVLKADAKPFNAVFRASVIESEIQALFLPVRDAWFQSPINVERRQALATQGTVGDDCNSRLQQAWIDFAKEPMITDCFTELGRKCFWDPGSYTLELRIYTPSRGKPLAVKWEFSLDETQSKSLRLNAVTLLDQACGQSANVPLNFVHVEYESKDRESGGSS